MQFANMSATNAWLLANPERIPGGIHLQSRGAMGAGRQQQRREQQQEEDHEFLLEQCGPRQIMAVCPCCPYRCCCAAAPGLVDYLLQVNSTVKYFKDVSCSILCRV